MIVRFRMKVLGTFFEIEIKTMLYSIARLSYVIIHLKERLKCSYFYLSLYCDFLLKNHKKIFFLRIIH
jgi:hypothetical protein